MPLIDLPEWMDDCLRYYIMTQDRPPTSIEILAWQEAVSSVRMERNG